MLRHTNEQNIKISQELYDLYKRLKDIFGDERAFLLIRERMKSYGVVG